ncbi:hypothetical protein PMAC_001110 [Pneumocystis sp. 'macacae']|nr:hypothetical protein PMAC_001110 [Pneumocystis sp. 'macacae']
MIHTACDELEAAQARYVLEDNSQSQTQLALETNSASKLNEHSQKTVESNHRSSDMYLGLLHSRETAAVYGSITNTQIKFIVVLDDSEMVITDADMKLVFKAIHSAYIAHVCNPFYAFDDKTPIQSRKFDKMIEQIVESWAPNGMMHNIPMYMNNVVQCITDHL